jgi:hypothetical protein
MVKQSPTDGSGNETAKQSRTPSEEDLSSSSDLEPLPTADQVVEKPTIPNRPCAVCKLNHVACDRARPCQRCRKANKEKECVGTFKLLVFLQLTCL